MPRVVCVILLMMTGTAPAALAQVGDVSFANSGAPAAQKAFAYGLAQLHNFEYTDAARSFREAQQIDPGFVMAYWGEAMTRNHPVWMEQDLGGARRILEKLGPTSSARLAKVATARERDYLESIEILFGPGDKHARDLAYRDAMRGMHSKYRDDVDAAAFYGLALLGSVTEGRDDAIYMQAAAVLEEAFRAHPDHPGLAHYLIHSYDDPPHAHLGLPAARKYSTIAAAAPHALHMTSHIYLAAGLWDDVVNANEQARRVGSERARRAGAIPSGCGHVNMWLMYGYLQQGRRPEARRVLDACREQATGSYGLTLRAPEQDPLDPDNIPAGSYVQMWSRYLIDTGEWDGDVARQEIPLGDLAAARLTRAFVLALGVSGGSAPRDAARMREALGRVRDARRALDAALAKRTARWEQHARRAAVLEDEIAALTELADGRPAKAVDILRAAVAAEDAMPVEFGPPFVDKPAAELLGEVLLEIGRPADAAAAYELSLRRAPNRAASRVGLAAAKARIR